MPDFNLPDPFSGPTWVDPPAGHLYGFPKLWKREEPLEEFLRKHKYPEHMIKIGHVRMWEENESVRNSSE